MCIVSTFCVTKYVSTLLKFLCPVRKLDIKKKNTKTLWLQIAPTRLYTNFGWWKFCGDISAQVRLSCLPPTAAPILTSGHSWVSRFSHLHRDVKPLFSEPLFWPEWVWKPPRHFQWRVSGYLSDFIHTPEPLLDSDWGHHCLKWLPCLVPSPDLPCFPIPLQFLPGAFACLTPHSLSAPRYFDLSCSSFHPRWSQDIASAEKCCSQLS